MPGHTDVDVTEFRARGSFERSSPVWQRADAESEPGAAIKQELVDATAAA